MPSLFSPLASVMNRLRARLATPQNDPLLRVLLVDDSTIDQQTAAEQLALLGIKPHLASSGEMAVQMSSTLDFDIILMDLEMRAMDGFEAAKRIRRLESCLPGQLHIPIVAYSSSKWLYEVGAQGRDVFDGILKKPCELAALKACLLQHCTRDSLFR